MHEFARVRQDRRGHRRLFTDRDLDLYVWYAEAGSEVIGFQLVYDKEGAPRAFTWLRNRGYRHDRIDETEARHRNTTPILGADGVFDARALAARLRACGEALEPRLLALVCGALESSDAQGEDRTL
jgi:hypothetical protein